jgi:hypothetical protein
MFALPAGWNEFVRHTQSKIEQWRSYHWALRLNRHQEMVCTLSAYTTRFTILSHCYIQIIEVGQDTENCAF